MKDIGTIILRTLTVILVTSLIAFVIMYFLPRQTRIPIQSEQGSTHAAVYDTVINQGIYQSYFSNSLHEPVFVTYVLYHAGGSCDRQKAHMHFHLDGAHVYCARASDYKSSGYDEGHLADAKDFAYDCTLEELTFRFYNCVPQRPELNRGPWEHWEKVARTESQSDSILIVTGSTFKQETTIGNSVRVPDHCWKVIETLTKKNVLDVIWCDNTEHAACQTVTIEWLDTELGYRVPIR